MKTVYTKQSSWWNAAWAKFGAVAGRQHTSNDHFEAVYVGKELVAFWSKREQRGYIVEA